MERPRKTTESRIMEIESKKAQYQEKIETYNTKIADLDQRIQELKDLQKQKELENLMELIKTTGKTPAEVFAALKSSP